MSEVYTVFNRQRKYQGLPNGAYIGHEGTSESRSTVDASLLPPEHILWKKHPKQVLIVKGRVASYQEALKIVFPKGEEGTKPPVKVVPPAPPPPEKKPEPPKAPPPAPEPPKTEPPKDKVPEPPKASEPPKDPPPPPEPPKLKAVPKDVPEESSSGNDVDNVLAGLEAELDSVQGPADKSDRKKGKKKE